MTQPTRANRLDETTEEAVAAGRPRRISLRTLRASATAHVKSGDVVATLLTAALLAPAVVTPIGWSSDLPFAWNTMTLLLVVAGSVTVTFLLGVRSRGDLSAVRAVWLLVILLPASALFGWLTWYRANSFFTASALNEASAILLVATYIAALLERRAAKGTPSDVLAISTSNTAAFALLLFWLFTALNQHLVASVMLLLVGLLLLLTILLRLPGALVPIYRARRTWRRRRRRKQA